MKPAPVVIEADLDWTTTSPMKNEAPLGMPLLQNNYRRWEYPDRLLISKSSPYAVGLNRSG